VTQAQATLRAVQSTPHPSVEPSFSLRLVLPFVKLLAGHKGISGPLLQKLSAMGPDDRLPISAVLRWLDSAVEISRDPDLGLRAVRRIESGSYDVLEYMARSASNYGEALELQLRYIRLVNEAADFTLGVREGRAFIDLRSRVVLTRAASDFQACALLIAARAWLGSLDSFELWFSYPAPSKLDTYREVLGSTPVRFGAAHDAISFDAKLLEVPMKSADPKLNAVLRRHAEHLIAELPEPEWLTGRVRKLLMGLLPAGKTNADYVATRLGMSRRTLTRHLEREGVTYKDLLEQARRELSFQYLANPATDIQQIAFLLGYSETAAFSRAFRRWSGQSPAAYRRSPTK
jgi:AraC-like DNA-binding protein